jgi:hypothetical protein
MQTEQRVGFYFSDKRGAFRKITAAVRRHRQKSEAFFCRGLGGFPQQVRIMTPLCLTCKVLKRPRKARFCGGLPAAFCRYTKGTKTGNAFLFFDFTLKESAFIFCVD